MSKPLKLSLAVLAAFVLLLLAGGAYVASRFDAEGLKALAIERVQHDHARTLAMPGPLQLAFWPSLGVKLGEVSLSEARSNAPFASLRSAHVSLAVWPLLHGQVIVDRVRIEGLSVAITRGADGHTSIDDLVGLPKSGEPATTPGQAGAPLVFDIAGITLADLKLRFDDRQAGRVIELSQAELQTGRLTPGQPTELSFKGRLGSSEPAAEVQISLKTQLLFDPGQQHLAFEGLDAKFDSRQPAGQLALQGRGDVRLARHEADLQLGGSFDGSRFSLKAGVPSFSPLQTRFELDVDQLDLDRLRPAAAAASAPAAAHADLPIDLSALRELHTEGTMHIGKLHVAGLHLDELRATLKAAGGHATIAPLQASLYGGKASGSLMLDAGAVPKLSLSQTLSDIHIGPLLKDALGKAAPIDGHGSVVMDVASQGGSLKALRQALAGRAKLELRDGAVHGFNIAQAIRSAKARLGLGGAGGGTGNTAESSDFSELTGSLVIHHGVARNDDLLAKSPLLRVTGSGDVDLANERLDYLVKATVVPTLQGQGGPELQALSGQTIPVRLAGPFTAVDYHVDFGGIAQDLARQKIGEKAKEQLQDRLKKLLGR